MDPNIEIISEEFAHAVKLIMDPMTPQDIRITAHKKVEDFRDTSPMRARVGFSLASNKQNEPIIQHCGLQLIDHHVRFHWNSISINDKVVVKDSIMTVIEDQLGASNIPHIKDALSRIIVEIVKREWPQQWPTFMDEMHKLCQRGEDQLDIVLLIFTRLAEDIVQFQNVQDQRRKEIYRTLCGHTESLFTFFKQTLERRVQTCEASVWNSTEVQRVKTVLEAISAYVEWAPLPLVLSLTHMLSALVQCHKLGCCALSTINGVLQWKGKAEERKSLLVFFNESALFQENNFEDCMSSEEYYQYQLLRVECFYNLSLLLPISVSKENPVISYNLSAYLESLTYHVLNHSLMISQTAQSACYQVLKSKSILPADVFNHLASKLLLYEVSRATKVNFKRKPGFNSSYSEGANALEFDSEEEFDQAFGKYRGTIGDIIRILAEERPDMAFNEVEMNINQLLQNLRKSDATTSSKGNDPGAWDAVVFFVSAACAAFIKKINAGQYQGIEELANRACVLMNACCAFDGCIQGTTDASKLSVVLSCMSALSCFATFVPTMLATVLLKVFSHLKTCKLSEADEKWDDLRRHSCALLIKLASHHPKLLLPEFNMIYAHIKTLFQSDEYLTAFDKCSLLEALIILSNHFNDFSKQSEVLREALSSIESIWNSPEFLCALESPEGFLSFLGVDKPERSQESITHMTRLNLATNVIKVCIRRSAWPSDQEVALRNGFKHPLNNEGSDKIYLRNPVALHVVPLLGNVFKLFKVMHSLFDPVYMQKIHPNFSSILDLSEADKTMLLGKQTKEEKSTREKTSAERVQLYFQTLYDCCVNILGVSVENMQLDFYILPDLFLHLANNVFYKVNFLQHMKLKNLFHVFLYPFILSCPVQYHDDMMTFLSGLCTFMLQTLSSSWEKFRARYGEVGAPDYDDDQTEVEEILTDQQNRLLSREYMHLMVNSVLKPTNDNSENGMSTDDETTSVSKHALNELGNKILETDNVRSLYVYTAFESLRWPDTTTNIKSIHLCVPLLVQLKSRGLIRSQSEAEFILHCILSGIQELGQHVDNLGLLTSLFLMAYESLIPMFPHLRQSVMNITGCTHEAIQRLDDCMSAPKKSGKGDKFRRDAAKAVLGNIVGRNLGSKHKHSVVIQNLPPLLNLRVKDPEAPFRGCEDLGLCSLFGPAT